MDVKARNAVNLKVLRRYEPEIVAIADSSSHIVIYDFNTKSKTWAKKGIEGTLFLMQRASAPYYSMFVLNRLSTENFKKDLSAAMEVQVLGDYVIFRTDDDLVQGLWMYEASDRVRLAKSLQKYCSLSGGRPQIMEPQIKHQPQQQQQGEKTISVMDLFAKAQSSANTIETNHTTIPQQQQQPTPDASNSMGIVPSFTPFQHQPGVVPFQQQNTPLVELLYQSYRSGN
ncbi:mRNA-decapping enzyme 1B [Phlyctochytrium planicorne]|nr:mRNA-decapping enzyme 1B [Phlyctochytrium planicorne]